MNAPRVTELAEACSGMIRHGQPARFVRLFKPRFARLVESGEKTQTIRPLPKRIPRRGDTLSLREWTGKPYRSKQRVLLETRLEEIKVCIIDNHGIMMQPRSGCLPDKHGAPHLSLGGEQADRFARTDGFTDWNEMRDWFRAEHGLPFVGVVLYWDFPGEHCEDCAPEFDCWTNGMKCRKRPPASLPSA